MVDLLAALPTRRADSRDGPISRRNHDQKAAVRKARREDLS
jgi:hypothetical protein